MKSGVVNFQDLMVGDLSRAEDYKLNAMDELMTDFGQVDIEALRVEIEKNEVDRQINSEKMSTK